MVYFGWFNLGNRDLAAEHGEETTVMINATYLMAHHTATSMGVKKGGRGRLITARQGIAQQCPEREGKPRAA